LGTDEPERLSSSDLVRGSTLKLVCVETFRAHL